MSSIKRAALDSAFSTGFKLVGGFITIKILAMALGPDGFGKLGNLFSAVSILNVLASCGIGLGITRYIGKYNSNTDLSCKILGAGSGLTIAASFVITLIMFVFSEPLSLALFKTDQYSFSIKIASFFVVPIGYSSFGISLLNGFGATTQLMYVRLFSMLLGSAVLFLLVQWNGEIGAVLGLFFIAACPVLPVFISLRKILPSFWKYVKPRFDWFVVKRLIAYALATVVTAVSHGYVQIFLRDYIWKYHGVNEVGIWQGMLRISDAYMQVFVVFLVAYLLPRLSGSQGFVETKVIVLRVYRFIAPSLLLTFCLIYLLRDELIRAFLSASFSSVSDLFLTQLAADFFRVLSYVVGYIAVARAYMPLLFLMDPLQGLLIFSAGLFLVPQSGAQGACSAYFIAFFVYFIVSIFVFLWCARRQA